MTTVAIIGAGLSGLTLARHLGDSVMVDVFEKSTRPGGRIASRVTKDTTFDHGAQFIVVKTPAFADFISPMVDGGIIKDWQARFVEFDGQEVLNRRQWTSEFPHYVGCPSMAAIGEWLSTGLNIHYDQTVTNLKQQHGQWSVSTAQGTWPTSYDWVIVTTPAEQAAALLPEETRFNAALSDIHMLPCYALMVTLKEDPGFDFDAALVKHSNISWVSVNHSKPERQGFSLLVHAANAWAADNSDLSPDAVSEAMQSTLCKVTGLDPALIKHCEVKHWRYANITKHENGPFFVDNKFQLAACGDWCIAGRVEAAFTSASLLADKLSQTFDQHQ